MQCETCGQAITIGEWPWCPHGQPAPSKGFEPYVDIHTTGKPVTVSNPGDRNAMYRPHWENDHIVQVVPRDMPKSYWKDLAVRREERREKTMKGK